MWVGATQAVAPQVKISQANLDKAPADAKCFSQGAMTSLIPCVAVHCSGLSQGIRLLQTAPW
jgi:hypothetical protein